jgi:hypothetical protein
LSLSCTGSTLQWTLRLHCASSDIMAGLAAAAAGDSYATRFVGTNASATIESSLVGYRCGRKLGSTSAGTSTTLQVSGIVVSLEIESGPFTSASREQCERPISKVAIWGLWQYGSLLVCLKVVIVVFLGGGGDCFIQIASFVVDDAQRFMYT